MDPTGKRQHPLSMNLAARIGRNLPIPVLGSEASWRSNALYARRLPEEPKTNCIGADGSCEYSHGRLQRTKQREDGCGGRRRKQQDDRRDDKHRGRIRERRRRLVELGIISQKDDERLRATADEMVEHAVNAYTARQKDQRLGEQRTQRGL